MLNNILNTNEVKDAAGAEIEFSRISTVGRTSEFAKVAETPNLPFRIQIAHRETGSLTKLRRSSKLEIVETTIGADGTPAVTRTRIVQDSPVGNLSSDAVPKRGLAALGSLVFTTGASTFLYDGTGNGAKVLLNGDF